MYKLLISFIFIILYLIPGLSFSDGIDTRPATSGSGIVAGSIHIPEGSRLPADAVLRVELRDVSLMDVAAKRIAGQVITPLDAMPVDFAIAYDPDQIDERFSYSIFAQIRRGEKLLFVSDRSYPVLTRGHGSQVNLMLKAISP